MRMGIDTNTTTTTPPLRLGERKNYCLFPQPNH